MDIPVNCWFCANCFIETYKGKEKGGSGFIDKIICDNNQNIETANLYGLFLCPGFYSRTAKI